MDVANWGSNTISVINANTDRVEHTISGVVYPTKIATAVGGLKLYVANSNTNTISVINGSKVIKNVTVGENPESILVDHYNDKAYVTNSQNNTISVINGFNDTELGAITLPMNSDLSIFGISGSKFWGLPSLKIPGGALRLRSIRSGPNLGSK